MSEMTEKMISVFANGSEYGWWLSRNCERCKKYDPTFETVPTCEIDEAITEAAMDDGTVPESIAKRMGLIDGFRCTEIDPIRKDEP